MGEKNEKKEEKDEESEWESEYEYEEEEGAQEEEKKEKDGEVVEAEDLGPPDNVDMPEVVDWEMQAFEECESDGEEGLTWNEVEACEDKFGTLLAEKGIGLPSQTDFEAADLNNDGNLMFEEWMEWANLA